MACVDSREKGVTSVPFWVMSFPLLVRCDTLALCVTSARTRAGRKPSSQKEYRDYDADSE